MLSRADVGPVLIHCRHVNWNTDIQIADMEFKVQVIPYS